MLSEILEKYKDRQPMDLKTATERVYPISAVIDMMSDFAEEKLIEFKQSTPTHGRTAEEILASVHSEYKIKYPNNPIPDTITDPILLEIVIKAMHDFRTQPQQVREEIECTHPYKECVMSDRVNKNGTPLTRCSVCGNDNICDEELMDELVNTFTKEDLRTAFNGAEYFVDFDKWFDTLSTPIK